MNLEIFNECLETSYFLNQTVMFVFVRRRTRVVVCSLIRIVTSFWLNLHIYKTLLSCI